MYPFLYKHLPTYLENTHKDRPSQVSILKKKKPQPSRWATYTPTLSLTQHTGERQVRHTGTAQYHPPKATNDIITAVITYN